MNNKTKVFTILESHIFISLVLLRIFKLVRSCLIFFKGTTTSIKCAISAADFH